MRTLEQLTKEIRKLDFCDQDLVADLKRLSALNPDGLTLSILNQIVDDYHSVELDKHSPRVKKEMEQSRSEQAWTAIYHILNHFLYDDPKLSQEEKDLFQRAMTPGYFTNFINFYFSDDITDQQKTTLVEKRKAIADALPHSASEFSAFENYQSFIQNLSTEFMVDYDPNRIEEALNKIEQLKTSNEISKADARAMAVLLNQSTYKAIYAEYILAEDPEKFRSNLNHNQTLEQQLQERGINLEVYRNGIEDQGIMIDLDKNGHHGSTILEAKVNNFLEQAREYLEKADETDYNDRISSWFSYAKEMISSEGTCTYESSDLIAKLKDKKNLSVNDLFKELEGKELATKMDVVYAFLAQFIDEAGSHDFVDVEERNERIVREYFEMSGEKAPNSELFDKKKVDETNEFLGLFLPGEPGYVLHQHLENLIDDFAKRDFEQEREGVIERTPQKLRKKDQVKYFVKKEQLPPTDIRFGNDGGCCVGVYDEERFSNDVPVYMLDQGVLIFGIYHQAGEQKARRSGMVLAFPVANKHQTVLLSNSTELSELDNPTQKETLTKIVDHVHDYLRRFAEAANLHPEIGMGSHNYNTSKNFMSGKIIKAKKEFDKLPQIKSPYFYSEVLEHDENGFYHSKIGDWGFIRK